MRLLRICHATLGEAESVPAKFESLACDSWRSGEWEKGREKEKKKRKTKKESLKYFP